mgnify:CR=1 FL=1
MSTSATNAATSQGNGGTGATAAKSADLQIVQRNIHFDTGRKKRQTSQTYGDIVGLPISFGIVLPASCCGSEAIIVNSETGSCKYNYRVHQFYKKLYIKIKQNLEIRIEEKFTIDFFMQVFQVIIDIM